MSDILNPSIAVVGSGPSGCYVAQFLTRQWPDSDITILERLPAPYGLIRYGVAPDHQGAKAVTNQFDRLFTSSGVRFAGNVTVGQDIAFHHLAESFDIVILATGLPCDRELDVPRAPEARVIGAGGLLRALNSHPQPASSTGGTGRHAALGRRLVVVGMGNVAVDVVRLLCKEASGLVGSDIDDRVRQQLLPESPISIDVISRSSAAQAKCDVSMLRELAALPNVAITVTGLTPHDEGPVAETLRACGTEAQRGASSPTATTPTTVTLHFGLAPDNIEATSTGRSRIHAVSDDGTRRLKIDADTIVTAIGFTHSGPEDPGCPSPDWSGAHVYRVGWLSRGPKGTIPENRRQARAVAETVMKDVAAGRITFGSPGFGAIEPLIRDRVVGFAGWQRIEKFELKSAPPDRCRRKVTDVNHMLTLAGCP